MCMKCETSVVLHADNQHEIKAGLGGKHHAGAQLALAVALQHWQGPAVKLAVRNHFIIVIFCAVLDKAKLQLATHVQLDQVWCFTT